MKLIIEEEIKTNNVKINKKNSPLFWKNGSLEFNISNVEHKICIDNLLEAEIPLWSSINPIKAIGRQIIGIKFRDEKS